MGKYAHDDVMDAALDDIRNNANAVHACSSQPANYAAVAGVSLGSVAISSSDMVKANGDTSGRKLTITPPAGTVGSSGTGDHVAVVDTVNSKLLLVTTAPSQVLNVGNPLTMGAFKYEIADPV